MMYVCVGAVLSAASGAMLVSGLSGVVSAVRRLSSSSESRVTSLRLPIVPTGSISGAESADVSAGIFVVSG